MNSVGGALEGLVVSLREGIEVALVVGVLLAYLNRTGRRSYGRIVLLGLGAAVLASLGGAIVVRRYGFNPETPAVEGSLMFVAAMLVTSLLAWMWRTGKSVRRRLERRMDTLVTPATAHTVQVRTALGIFAFAFFMVLREGVETVLFLTALSATPGSRPTAQLSGAVVGLCVAALFGTFLVRGSVRIDLRRFFTVTGLVLVVLVAKLVAGGLHEFFEAGMLAATPFWEGTIEVFTSQAASVIVLALLITAPLGSLAWDWWRPVSAAVPEQPDGARP